MAYYIEKTKGNIVDLPDEFLPKVDHNGFLSRFNIGNIQYMYYGNNYTHGFRNEVILENYYSEEKYIAYLQNKCSYPELLESFFPFRDEIVDEGGEVSIERMDYGNYQNLNRKTYTFLYSRNDALNTKSIKIPEGINGIEIGLADEYLSLSRFYQKNFGEHVDDWDISPNRKQAYGKVMSRICFLIKNLKDILILRVIEIINYNNYLNEFITVDDDTWQDLDSYKKILFALFKTWGEENFSDIRVSATEIIEFNPVVPIFENKPTPLKYYLNYYKELEAFYLAIYRDAEEIRDENSFEKKVKKLLNILPPIAISLIPFDIKKGILKDFISNKKKYVSNEDFERAIAQIALGIRANRAEDFLNFLIKKEKQGNIFGITNFESLYQLVTDKSISRISPFFGGIYNLFKPEFSNRKAFIYVIYELWKRSKYNFYYTPEGINVNRLNENSYFLQETNKRFIENTPSILEFSTSLNKSVIDTSILGTGAYQSVKGSQKFVPQKKLEGVNIIIKIIEEKNITTTVVAGGVGGSDSSSNEKKEDVYGKYHLYLPITLIGYKPDNEITISETSQIPAFLFYYASEFDRLKDIDASISFTIDVVLEVFLSFFTGGFAQLRHLQHLKYVTKYNQARKLALAPNVRVLVFRGVDSGIEVASVTAGLLNSTVDYIGTISNDPERKKLAQKLSMFFLLMSFTTAGASVLAETNKKAVLAADEVLTEIQFLSDAGKSHQLDAKLIDVLESVSGVKTVKLELFENNLAILNLEEGTNHIFNFFDAIENIEERFRFSESFKGINKLKEEEDRLSIWNVLNKNEGKYIREWEKVKPSTDWISFKLIGTNEKLLTHIFEGEINSGWKSILKNFQGEKEVSLEEIPIHLRDELLDHRHKWYKVTGKHHNSGGWFRIEGEPKFYFDKPTIEESKMKIKIDEMPETEYFAAPIYAKFEEFEKRGRDWQEGWKRKNISSFFPNNYTEFDIILKLSQARNNMKRLPGTGMLGRADDRAIISFSPDGVSAFPKISFVKSELMNWDVFKKADWAGRKNNMIMSFEIKMSDLNFVWDNLGNSSTKHVNTSKVFLTKAMNSLSWRTIRLLIPKLDNIIKKIEEPILNFETEEILFDIYSDEILFFDEEDIGESTMMTEDFRDILVIWGEFLTTNPE